MAAQGGIARFYGTAEIHKSGAVYEEIWRRLVQPEKERDPDNLGGGGRETMRRSWWTTMALAALVLATALGGCTAMRRDRAPETMSLLTQAGFKTLLADTPAKAAKLSTLTPYKIVPWTRKSGATVYAYAAPDLCRCVYVGSPKQYAKFRQLLSAEQAAEIAAQEKAEFEPHEFSEYTIEEGGA